MKWVDRGGLKGDEERIKKDRRGHEGGEEMKMDTSRRNERE